MSFRIALAQLRRVRVPIAVVAVGILLLVAVASLFLAEWWIALAALLAALALVVANFRAFLVYVLIGESFRSFKRGEYVASESKLREALPRVEMLAPDDPVRGMVYRDLAEITRLLGNYTDAETFGIKAVEVAETAYGLSHAETLDAVLSLARIYLDIARYPQAKQLLDRAMNALPAESAGPDWKQAIGLANLGRWWHEQGYHAEAEPIYRRAVEAFQKLGSSGAGVTVRFEFAKLLAKQGKPAEAEAILHATLEEENRTGTKDSLTLALCLDHLAMVRLLQGNVRDAEGLERRALAMLEKIAGPNTPALSPGMALLGGILKVQGKWHEAEESYREALLLREEYCAPEHPALAEVLEEYAELLEVMGRGEEAQMHHHRAHQIRDFHAASRLVG